MVSNRSSHSHHQTAVPVIEQLRSRTHAVHQRLHVHPVLAPLTSPDLTPARYVIALQSLQRFHEAVEHSLSGVPSLQNYSAAIAQDLVELGAGRSPLARWSLPEQTVDPDAVLGVRYVVEGSALGGQVIAKTVARTLNWPQDAPGLSHFRREGTDPGRQWRAFLKHVAVACRHPERCTSAAERTFGHLEQWLWQVHRESTGLPV